MAGLPPLAGFFTKFFIIHDLVVQQHIGLACYLVLMSGVGIYYSLRVIGMMCISPNKPSQPLAIVVAACSLFALLFAGTLVLVGCMPNTLLDCLQHCLAIA